MAEYILTVLVAFIIIYALVKGCDININISVKQEFSAEDRQLLEDVFNKEGDPKKGFDTQEAFDEAVKAINDIMLGNEEEANG